MSFIFRSATSIRIKRVSISVHRTLLWHGHCCGRPLSGFHNVRVQELLKFIWHDTHGSGHDINRLQIWPSQAIDLIFKSDGSNLI